MLREFRVSEMRYRAVLEVLGGAVISMVARRYGVSRQTVHAWRRRYAREGAVLNLEDRSSRPHGCPHQMAPELEARVLVLRDANPRWGSTRIVYELGREGVVGVPRGPLAASRNKCSPEFSVSPTLGFGINENRGRD